MRLSLQVCASFVAVALLCETAEAASVSYRLTGMTNFASTTREPFTPLTDVPITGTATLDFQGSRVSVIELTVSFDGLAEADLGGLLSLDGVVSVNSGSGLLMGNVLTFDQPSLAVPTLTCNGRADICGAAGLMVGVPKIVNTVGPFLLGDFVFDADGGFTTVQDFDGELPIGVGFTPGLALAAGSSSGTSFGVRLRATQVAEPPLLGLLALALLGLAAASLLEAAARGRRG